MISLDLELWWGVRDLPQADKRWRTNLLAARRAVHGILEVFGETGIAATWAVVGFLLARQRKDLVSFSPSIRPRYTDPRLDPYVERVGEDEDSDPMHYGQSLIRAIQATERQEIGTHTFSHYYCLAEGQDYDSFYADVRSAVAIAAHYGVCTRSMVFPRHQHNIAYDGALRENGIICYRGQQPGWLHRATRKHESPVLRMGRLVDSYLAVLGGQTTAWSQVAQPSGLCNIPGNLYLRPYSPRGRHLESLRLKRVEIGIRRAATRGEIFHIWWHPENFGVHISENISFLRSILELYERYRESDGLQSLSMSEVALMTREDGRE